MLVAVVITPLMVALMVPATFKLPPIHTSLPMPTPPNTCRAPVAVVVALVKLFSTNAPVLNVPQSLPTYAPPTSVPLLNHSNVVVVLSKPKNASLSVPL